MFVFVFFFMLVFGVVIFAAFDLAAVIRGEDLATSTTARAIGEMRRCASHDLSCHIHII